MYPNFTSNPETSTRSTPMARHFGDFRRVFIDGHVDGGLLDISYQPEQVNMDHKC